MQRYALVINGKVENVVEQDTYPDGWIQCPRNVGPGYLYSNGQFVLDEVATFNAPILARLAEIDRISDSPRTRREALIGNDNYMKQLDAEAASLRAQLRK